MPQNEWKIHPFAVHVYPSIFGNKEKIAHYTQHPLKNAVGYIYFLITNFDREMCTTILSVLLALVTTPQKYLSPCRALFFLIGTQSSNTGE